MSERPQTWDTGNGRKLEQLRADRRSYLVGTVLVIAISLLTFFTILALAIGPDARRSNASAQQAARIMATLQDWPSVAVLLAASVAVFVLNFRYSSSLQRPQWAFGAKATALGRLLWTTLLIFAGWVLFPLAEIAVAMVLAYWGKQQIAANEHGGSL
jgi:hypothetical protein